MLQIWRKLNWRCRVDILKCLTFWVLQQNSFSWRSVFVFISCKTKRHGDNRPTDRSISECYDKLSFSSFKFSNKQIRGDRGRQFWSLCKTSEMKPNRPIFLTPHLLFITKSVFSGALKKLLLEPVVIYTSNTSVALKLNLL